METIREASDDNNNKWRPSPQKLAFLRGFDNYLSWFSVPTPSPWMDGAYLYLTKCSSSPLKGRSVSRREEGKGLCELSRREKWRDAFRELLNKKRQGKKQENEQKQRWCVDGWMVWRWFLFPAERHSFAMGLFSARDVWHRLSLLGHVKVKMKRQHKQWQGRWGKQSRWKIC